MCKEQKSKLESEELQPSPETSTNGTYIRDGRLINDLVYSGEAEVSDTVEESITIQTGQTYGKSAYVAGDPDTDLISRQAAIEAWDKLSKRGRTEFDQVLMTLPSAETHAKRTETHGVCSECISRQAARNIISENYRRLGLTDSAMMELSDEVKSLPPVEPTHKAICEHFYKGYCSRFEDGCFWQCQKADRPRGEWVPCSERLPKYMVDMWDDGVIATVNGREGNIIYENGIVPDAWFEDGKWYVNDVELENAKVVAWMPLPEPYKGSDKE